MNQFKCEICGGTSIIQIDEKTYECQDCCLQYDVAEVEKLIVLPQEVVEEPAELTVDEQALPQPTFDVAQGSEDDFTKEAETEQETEEIAKETDTETVPEYIDSAPIEITENAEADTDAVIQQESQTEDIEKTSEEIPVVEPKTIEEEDIAYGVSEEITGTDEVETDSQDEITEIGVVPWYKNIKIIVPSAAGFALAILAVVLLIIFSPKENIPISTDTSSDIQSKVESSQIENATNSNISESNNEPNNVNSNEEKSSESTITNNFNAEISNKKLDFRYKILGNNTVEILGPSKSNISKDLIIPSSINGCAVTSVGAYSFSGNQLTSLIIMEGITNIGNNAFSGQESLVSIRLPNTLVTIGESAFYNCAITNIGIPYGVRTIGRYAFSRTSLTSITIPDSVISIGFGAFSDCTSLSAVTISNSVENIEDLAFAGTSLSTVYFYSEEQLEKFKNCFESTVELKLIL